jgi:hypothetical protein
MKTLKKFAGYLLIVAATYLLFAFGNLSFNVFDWNTFSRLFFGFLVIYFADETRELIF